jgi:hypothetical protein
MIEFLFFISYVVGIYMLQDTFHKNKMINVMDVIMFILSPFNIVNFIVIKIVSHFVDLEKVVFKTDDRTF